jgi:hypothetical protein
MPYQEAQSLTTPMSSSELSSFAEYERAFQALAAQLPLRITAVMTGGASDADATAELKKVESDLTQARQRLQDMEIEARGLSEATRREMGSKVRARRRAGGAARARDARAAFACAQLERGACVPPFPRAAPRPLLSAPLPRRTHRHAPPPPQIRTYKDSLAGVAADLKRAKERFSRSALMAGGGASSRPLDFDKSNDQRARMAATTDKLKSGSSVLADTHTRLEETVNVGEGIMGELHRNRETMVRVRGNVGVVSGALDEARKLLRGMMKREARTRVALGIFAVVIVAVIIGMIGARKPHEHPHARARAQTRARIVRRYRFSSPATAAYLVNRK